jgi:16S rRNA processing protein RimM
MTAKWEDMALVGRIARAHGIRGQVIVNPETDFPEDRFRPGANLFIQGSNGIEPITLTTVRFAQGRPVIGIAGIGDMTAAQTLAGLELRVPPEELAALPPGTFYRHDLVGCVVETLDGDRIGVVRAVEGSLGSSRLVVDGAGGEILVPLVDEICARIDPPGRLIVIRPPEGLLDLNRPARR